MKLSDIKIAVVAEFNLLISDTSARTYFADYWDLWGDSNSRYTNTGTGYKIALRRFKPQIDSELKKAEFILNEYTKKTEINSNVADTENQTTEKTTTGTVTDNRIITDGEFTQSNRQYPQGYTSAPDTAYISNQIHDSEFVKMDDSEQANAQTDDTIANKTATSVTDGDTVEIDTDVRLKHLAAYSRVYDVIEQCVFSFVANTTWGCF